MGEAQSKLTLEVPFDYGTVIQFDEIGNAVEIVVRNSMYQCDHTMALLAMRHFGISFIEPDELQLPPQFLQEAANDLRGLVEGWAAQINKHNKVANDSGNNSVS